MQLNDLPEVLLDISARQTKCMQEILALLNKCRIEHYPVLGWLLLVSDFLLGSFLCLLAAAGVFSLLPASVDFLLFAGVILLSPEGMHSFSSKSVAFSLAGAYIEVGSLHFWM